MSQNDEREGDALRTAKQTAEAISRRISNVGSTIRALEQVPGKKSDEVAALDVAKSRHAFLEQRLRDLWRRDADETLDAARQRLDRAVALHSSVETDFTRERENTGRQIEHYKAIRDGNKSEPNSPQYLRANEQITSLEKQLAARIEGEANAAQQVNAAREELRTAEQKVMGLAPLRLGDLEALRKEAEAAVDEVATLYERINSKKSLASVGKTVSLNQGEFIGARDYHRDAARHALWIIAGAVGASGLGIFFVFLRPDLETAKALITDGRANWPIIVELAAGRVSILVAAAWLVRFMGRLHSRHVQQAVSYQDRVAALDAAKTILEVGNDHERTETLGKMAAYYLAPGDNAFEERAPHASSSRQAERITKLLVKPIDTLAKALGEKVGGK